MKEYGQALRNRLLLAFGDVLDIGCGKAYLSHFVDERHSYVGIDANEQKIQRLKHEHVSRPNHKFHCVNIENENELILLTSYTSFDTITLLAVVEH